MHHLREFLLADGVCISTIDSWVLPVGSCQEESYLQLHLLLRPLERGASPPCCRFWGESPPELLGASPLLELLSIMAPLRNGQDVMSLGDNSNNNNKNNNFLQLNAVRAYSAHRGLLPLWHSLSWSLQTVRPCQDSITGRSRTNSLKELLKLVQGGRFVQLGGSLAAHCGYL